MEFCCYISLRELCFIMLIKFSYVTPTELRCQNDAVLNRIMLNYWQLHNITEIILQFP